MPDANVDYSYNEYANQMNDDNFVELNINGETLSFDLSDNEIIATPESSFSTSDTKYDIEIEEEFDEISTDQMRHNRFFEQRPDVKIIYDQLEENIANNITIYVKVSSYLLKLEDYLSTNDDAELQEKYDQLVELIELIKNENELLFSKKASISREVNGYNYIAEELDKVNERIKFFNCCFPEIEPGMTYEDVLATLTDTSDEKYLDYLKRGTEVYPELLNEQSSLQEQLLPYITASITLDDIQDQIKGYNSLIGLVPAGEWDACINPKYDGEGYVTGMAGSFEGPQGKETGYDSRKGDGKANYKDPDRTLLEYLSLVTDDDGNQLYPMESFEKGGKYYYHIFGVNDDGTINWDLIDNPRFGCKMLGDYLIVGGDQTEHRERGSKVMTSIGPAIVFDYGTIPDLQEDPSHIDISMDEVLFWLKNFSHNQDRSIETLAGIYDWCTEEGFTGLVDLDYEHMERNYVNNLNVTYNQNLTCIFDRDDFDDCKNYSSQEEFAYRLRF